MSVGGQLASLRRNIERRRWTGAGSRGGAPGAGGGEAVRAAPEKLHYFCEDDVQAAVRHVPESHEHRPHSPVLVEKAAQAPQGKPSAPPQGGKLCSAPTPQARPGAGPSEGFAGPGLARAHSCLSPEHPHCLSFCRKILEPPGVPPRERQRQNSGLSGQGRS